MTTQSPPLSLIGYGIFIVAAIVLMGTALGTKYWIEYESTDGVSFAHGGLYKVCTTKVTVECVSLSEVRDGSPLLGGDISYSDIKAVRGLCIAAITMYSITLFLLGHLVFADKLQPKSRNHGWITLVICILGGAFGCSAAIHYSASSGYDWLEKINWSNGYSLYLAAVSGVSAIFAGILSTAASFQLYRAMVPVVQPAIYSHPATMQVVTPVAYSYPPGTQPPQQPILAVPQYHMAGGQPPMTGYPNQPFAVKPQSSNVADAPPPAYET